MSNDPLLQALMSRFDNLESRLEGRFDRVDSKANSIEKDISRIDKTLVKQNADLEEHMARTALNEQRLELQQKAMERVDKEQTLRISAAEKFIEKANDFKKWMAWIVGVLISAGIADRIIEKLL